VISPATQHQDIIPIYGFNESSIFLTQTSFIPGKYLHADNFRNSKWDRLLAVVKRGGAQSLLISQFNPQFGG
jgi:hypothetical protein